MRDGKCSGRAFHYHCVPSQGCHQIGIFVERPNPSDVGSPAGHYYEMAGGLGGLRGITFWHAEEYTHRC